MAAAKDISNAPIPINVRAIDKNGELTQDFVLYLANLQKVLQEGVDTIKALEQRIITLEGGG